MDTDGEQSQAVLNELVNPETAAEITAIMALTNLDSAGMAITALEDRLEAEMELNGDSEPELHAQMVASKVENAWLLLRSTAGEALIPTCRNKRT